MKSIQVLKNTKNSQNTCKNLEKPVYRESILYDSNKLKIKGRSDEGALSYETNIKHFDEVLLLEKQKKIEIGTPLVKGVEVIGKILKQGKGKKVIVFKYKPRKRYKVKKGHRQFFTEVEIKEIQTVKN